MSIAIVYFSGSGATKKQAEAVLAGTGELGVLIEIDKDGNTPEDTLTTLDSVKAIIFGSSTLMGTCSWQFKKFAETSSSRFMNQAWKDKYFAGFTNSGNIYGDKGVTVDYFFHLAMQLGGIWVGLGTLPNPSDRSNVNYIGSFAGIFVVLNFHIKLKIKYYYMIFLNRCFCSDELCEAVYIHK